MRVLELGKFYPPDHGGMETALRDACRGLAARGHDVVAVVSSSTRRGRVDNPDGARVIRLPRTGTLRSVPINPHLASRLRGLLHEFDPDVVHLHLPNPGMGLAWMLFGDGRPLVVSYHSDIVRQKFLARVWGPWRAHLLRRAVRIVVASESLRTTSPALRDVRSRCTVIPYGIDVRWFDAVETHDVEVCRTDVGEDFLLFVGRLVYYKGLDVLLAALESTPIPLVVAGDGPLRPVWERAARQAGLGSRVRFLGDVVDVRLRALYHACTALVLPSTAASEAFGLVQLEAMACRKPVIATRVSGGVESVQVDGRTGRLVPPRDAAALRDALVSVWDDRPAAARMGEAGRRRVEDLYDLPRSVERLEDVLVAAAKGSGASHPGVGT